jgi:uncharacterized protein
MPNELQNHEPALPEATLLEGIVSTLNNDGSPHVTPMGPIVDSEFNRLLLRPFRTSTTFENLKRTGEGVLHVTDDVDLVARAAVGKLQPLPRLMPAKGIEGVILTDACRWYAFRVESLDDRDERTKILAKVVDRGTIREFFGFNRAKHAVVEAAILATRIHLLDAELIRSELDRLIVLVEKTGGRQEHQAFEFLRQYVRDELAKPPTAATEQVHG